MKTELILFHRPFNQILAEPDSPSSLSTGFDYTVAGNSNENITKSFQSIVRPNSPSTGGTSLDLYDNVSIPITYTILDIREPEKRKTSWSKTITIPGSKNNNRIFSHIYEIAQDGWITIGSQSVYEGFNPNIKKEAIILNDGIQVMKGNLQLKNISRDYNGNIEYEVVVSGELTSLFYDIGNSKLSDLDFTEWDHDWSKTNIINSWGGTSSKSDGTNYTSISSSSSRTISGVFRHSNTRLGVQTSTSHGYVVGTFVKLDMPNITSASGEWQVADVISSTQFTVNYFYPMALPNSGVTGTLGTVVRRIANGRGYVYPMISWGEEYDANSFPVTSFIPSFYAKEIWDKIMEETNSSYESDFLDSQFFKRLILTQKKSSYDLTLAEVNDRRFWVGSTQSFLSGASYKPSQNWYYLNTLSTSTATASIFPTIETQRFPFKSESGAISATVSFYDNGSTEVNGYGNWNQDTYKWIVRDSGEYRLSVNINLTGWCDMNGYDGGFTDGTASFTPLDPLTKYYPSNFGVNPSGPVGSQQIGTRVTAEIKRLRGGVISTIGSNSSDFILNAASFWTPTNANWKYFGRYQPSNWQNRNLSVESSSTDFRESDEVWVELKTYVQAPTANISTPIPFSATNPFRKGTISFTEAYDNPGEDDGIDWNNIIGEWYIRVDSQSYIVNDPSPKSVENSIIQAQSFLPKDLTCKDFLLAIIKMFNLHIEQDKQVDKKYYIEPRDEYYRKGTSATDFIDWTKKIDGSTVKITPMSELTAKYYIFENKEESDYWNTRFKTDRGRPYSYYNKEIQNDFLKNENKISIPLGTTVMINNPEGSDVVMPAILQRETNGAFKPVSNSQPRMLIWGGMRPYTANRGGAKINLNNSSFPNAYGWEMLSGSASSAVSASSSVFQQYPYAGTVDSPTDPIDDINWYNMQEGDFVYWDAARWTNANLYNKYWSNFINEISDPASKVITVSVNLSPADIFDLDFRKIYVIDNNWLRLQRVIDYDPISDGLTTCEFLKLKSPTKYISRSIIVDSSGFANSSFETMIDTTRPVINVVREIAPVRKRPDLGYNNATSGVNLSNNATVTTNGLSNFISSSVTNVTLNGNENVVGNNSNNITVSGGNGNFIAGNVTNVNLVGTSKKFITESDVTYINGVRYKNGMPISKSNVIDGGLNIPTIKQSITTTANIIDGCEDEVIFAGSATYENIINAGQDLILPDIQDLGISTTVNANPRTNLTGGFDLQANRQLVDVVRDAQASRSL
jgi:hypothetical protein